MHALLEKPSSRSKKRSHQRHHKPALIDEEYPDNPALDTQKWLDAHDVEHKPSEPNFVSEYVIRSDLKETNEPDTKNSKYITNVGRSTLYENDETSDSGLESLPLSTDKDENLSDYDKVRNGILRVKLSKDCSIEYEQNEPSSVSKSSTAPVQEATDTETAKYEKLARNSSIIEEKPSAPPELTDEVSFSAEMTNQVEAPTPDFIRNRNSASNSATRIGWSLHETQKAPAYASTIGFQGLTALPPYPIEGSATVQPPYPIEKSFQPPYPVEKNVQAPYPIEKSVQPPYPIEKSAQPPYPIEKNLQAPYAIQQSFQTPYPVEKNVQSPYPPEMSIQTPYPVERTSQKSYSVDRPNYDVQPAYNPFPIAPYPMEGAESHPVPNSEKVSPKPIGLESVTLIEEQKRKYLTQEDKELIRSSVNKIGNKPGVKKPKTLIRRISGCYFDDTPLFVQCPFCKKFVMTKVKSNLEMMSLAGRFFAQCLLDVPESSKHYCSYCRKLLGHQNAPCRFAYGKVN